MSPKSRKKRRSSLRKQSTTQQGVNSSYDENSPTKLKTKRRVSFAEKKHIKEFCHSTEQGTVWDNTYEERDLSLKGSDNQLHTSTIRIDKENNPELNETCYPNISMEFTAAVPTCLRSSLSHMTQNQNQNLQKDYDLHNDNKSQKNILNCDDAINCNDISMEITQPIPIAIISTEDAKYDNDSMELTNVIHSFTANIDKCVTDNKKDIAFNTSMEITATAPSTAFNTSMEITAAVPSTVYGKKNELCLDENLRNIEEQYLDVEAELQIEQAKNSNKRVNTDTLNAEVNTHALNITVNTEIPNTSMEITTAVPSTTYERKNELCLDKQVNLRNIEYKGKYPDVEAELQIDQANNSNNIVNTEALNAEINTDALSAEVNTQALHITVNTEIPNTSMEITAAVPSATCDRKNELCLGEQVNLRNIECKGQYPDVEAELQIDQANNSNNEVNIEALNAEINTDALSAEVNTRALHITVNTEIPNTSMEIIAAVPSTTCDRKNELCLDEQDNLRNIECKRQYPDVEAELQIDQANNSNNVVNTEALNAEKNSEGLNSEVNAQALGNTEIPNTSMEITAAVPSTTCDRKNELCLDEQVNLRNIECKRQYPDVEAELQIDQAKNSNNEVNTEALNTGINTEALNITVNTEIPNTSTEITAAVPSTTYERKNELCLNKQVNLPNIEYKGQYPDIEAKLQINQANNSNNEVNVEALNAEINTDALNAEGNTQILNIEVNTEVPNISMEITANVLTTTYERKNELFLDEQANLRNIECKEQYPDVAVLQVEQTKNIEEKQCSNVEKEIEIEQHNITNISLIEEDWFSLLVKKLKIYTERENCIWYVYKKNIDKKRIAFGFLQNSLLIVLSLSKDLNCSEQNFIKKTKVVSLLADNASIFAEIVHGLVLEKINAQELMNIYKTYDDILPMLDFVSQNVKLAMDFMLDLKQLDNLNLMDIAADKISFVSLSEHMEIILKVTINIKRFDKLTPNDINLHCLLGRNIVREKDVKDLIINVKKDHKFLRRYMDDIKKYVDIMEGTY